MSGKRILVDGYNVIRRTHRWNELFRRDMGARTLILMSNNQPRPYRPVCFSSSETISTLCCVVTRRVNLLNLFSNKTRPPACFT